MNLFTRAACLVILAMGAAFTVCLAACGGDAAEDPRTPRTTGGVTPTVTVAAVSTPEPASTVETTPTTVSETSAPLPESSGMDGFRAFAAGVDSALTDGDASFFADRGLETEMTCAGDESFGPCLDQPAGIALPGIPSATIQSEPSVLLTPDDYAATLRDWFLRAKADLSDEYGSGGLVLYALAHQPAGDGIEEAYQTVVTGIFTVATADFRQARILSYQFLDGSWRLTRERFATVPETIESWLSGECDFCYDRWERW